MEKILTKIIVEANTTQLQDEIDKWTDKANKNELKIIDIKLSANYNDFFVLIIYKKNN